MRLQDYVKVPIPFPSLIQLIRREEAERTARKLRLKQQARIQSVTAQPSEMSQLQDRLAQLETRLSEKTETTGKVETQISIESPPEEEPSELIQINQRLANIEKRLQSQSKRDFFCYRCGQDAHLATDCKNPPNKLLVQQKVEARRKKRDPKN